jgi:pyroglutamyl-peptidase
MAFRVLVTGFEAFGNSTTNPSESIVRRLEALHERRPLACGLSLHTTVLPVVGGIARGSARHALRIAIARCWPNAVVCFGEAASRSSICVERVAYNERAYRIADNGGARVVSAPVTRGAPASLRSTAIDAGMLRAMRDAVRSFGASVRMSDDAGRFLCNEVLFDCLHRARGAYAAVFIHVPQTPAQAQARGDCGGTPLPAAISARAAVAAVRWLAGR